MVAQCLYLTIVPKWESSDADNLDIVPLSEEKSHVAIAKVYSENPWNNEEK